MLDKCFVEDPEYADNPLHELYQIGINDEFIDDFDDWTSAELSV